MVFSSHIFVYYFLPIAILSYYLLPYKAKHFGLTFLSYLFYGWANPAFVLLMFASTVVDYTCGRVISGTEYHRNRKLCLIISICSNLSLLGFFKYFNFAKVWTILEVFRDKKQKSRYPFRKHFIYERTKKWTFFSA